MEMFVSSCKMWTIFDSYVFINFNCYFRDVYINISKFHYLNINGLFRMDRKSKIFQIILQICMKIMLWYAVQFNAGLTRYFSIGLVLLILLIRLPILRIGNCGEHPKRWMKIRRLPETVLSKGKGYDIGSYSPIYIFSGILTARERKRKKGDGRRKEKFVLQSSTEL